MTQDLKKEVAVLLNAALEAVIDEVTFIAFMQALATDWETEREIEEQQPSSQYSSGALGWENGTIGAFLDAAIRWGEASKDGLHFYEVPANPWRRAADILSMGKLYE